MRMICCLPGFFLIMVLLGASPYEGGIPPDPNLKINAILRSGWKEKNIAPPETASDAVFLRRVYLTVAGRLPTIAEARRFLADKSQDKRAKLIDSLLASPEYADLLAMRFADMLRIKSEFPINLWPNAVQAWHRQIRAELLADRSYRDMTRDMLTASGSNFRIPHANFFRASADRSPLGLAKAVALTFTGIRLENLPEEEQKRFAEFFSRIRYKSTYEWKEEIVYTDFNPVRIKARALDGETFTINSPEEDPRQIFADWLLEKDNPYFARAAVNRVWHWIFGRGIMPETDNLALLPGFWGRIFSMFRAENGNNAPFNPELLAYLEQEFKDSNYSIRHLYRTILNSEAFQATAMNSDPKSVADFASYPVRRLDSEILVDALASASGGYDRYMSVIPEPFTFLPPATRAVTIADGSISTGVLDSFGRPPRDSGRYSERNGVSTESQRLYLLNSGTLYRRLSNLPWKLFKGKRINDRQRLDLLYLHLLSRYPTQEEFKTFDRYRKTFAPKQRHRVWPDVAWVLAKSKEFLYDP